MFFQQNLLNFSMFQKFSPAHFSVPNLAGLMERFFCIPTGRILFYNFFKFLTLKISKIEV